MCVNATGSSAVGVVLARIPSVRSRVGGVELVMTVTMMYKSSVSAFVVEVLNPMWS